MSVASDVDQTGAGLRGMLGAHEPEAHDSVAMIAGVDPVAEPRVVRGHHDGDPAMRV